MLLNTPHNPTGKVFTREELELVCALAVEHDAWVVTDEVYEHLTYDGAEHVAVATCRGWPRAPSRSRRRERRVHTGWKVGWVSGPAATVTAARTVKQFLTYVGRGPFQPVGVALDDADGGHGRLPRRPGGARSSGGGTGSPTACGRPGSPSRSPRGAPTSWWPTPCPAGHRRTRRRCAAGCPSWPASSRSRSRCSTTTSTPRATLVRFAFCKRDDVLDEACRRLAALRV